MSQTPYPPGPPPMNPPPGGAYGSVMPPGGQREGNGPAIAALVMGLLLCIPFITGLDHVGAAGFDIFFQADFAANVAFVFYA